MDILHAGLLDTLAIYGALAWLLRGIVKAHEARLPRHGAPTRDRAYDLDAPEGEEEWADTELLWLPDELDD